MATDHPGAAACPGCGTVSERVHEYVLTRPGDLRRGLDEVSVCWLKRRWKCPEPDCERATFTESLPAVGAPVTGRLRELAGAEVAGRGCTVTEAARWQRMSWPVAHAAFAAHAEPVLARPLRPVATWASISTAADGPGWRIDAETGEYILLGRDTDHVLLRPGRGSGWRWGRRKAVPLMTPRTGWRRAPRPARSHPGGRDRHVQHLRLGGTADAAGRAAPSWTVLHVVQLAVKMTGDVRRRVVRARYGRRGRSGDPEYGIKGLLVRNLEHLRPAQFAKIMDTLGADRRGQEIAAAWIAKEKLRDVLNLRARLTGSVPCERNVRDRLFRFYDWCAQNDEHPRAADTGPHDLPVGGGTGSRRRADGSDERQVRKPEPDRQARSPPGILLPQPRETSADGVRAGPAPGGSGDHRTPLPMVTLGDRPGNTIPVNFEEPN